MRLAITNSKQTNFKIYEIAKLQEQYTHHIEKMLSARDDLEAMQENVKKVGKTLGINDTNIQIKKLSDKLLNDSIVSIYEEAKSQLSKHETIEKHTNLQSSKEAQKIRELIFDKVKSLNIDNIDLEKLNQEFDEHRLINFEINDEFTALEIENQFPEYFYCNNIPDRTHNLFHQTETQMWIYENKDTYEKAYQASINKKEQDNSHTMSIS
jgi:hypothetical protein